MNKTVSEHGEYAGCHIEEKCEPCLTEETHQEINVINCRLLYVVWDTGNFGL